MTDPRGIYRAPGGSGDAVADTSNESVTAINAAAEAEASKIAAGLSADSAANSATAASVSASNAATSATNSANSATSSASSATAAQTAETNAETAETNAETAQAAAELAEDNANASAALAQDWATKTSGPVAGSEYSAKYNANLASTSATNASSSASAASSSASSASSSASTATTKASEASTSASNAATSASNAASSASTASTKASEASTSASNAASSASTASTQASNAASSASTATTQAGIATTKAGEAATSESNAATSASNASTSATNAASSATSANTAKLAAEAAQSATETIYDNFDDRYLGAKASDPTLDNDGNALVIGALFFSTTDNIMKVYTATGWLSAFASLSGALLAFNNLSDVNNISTSRTNLGLGSIATQSASSVNITGGTIDGVALTNIVDLEVANNVQIDGNLTVSGTTVTLNATNLAVEDNMIYLNDGSVVTNPDLGIAGNYNDGTYRHAGVFRDASDGRWKFFHQYTPEPDASAYIDTSHASFALADLQVNTLYGNVTGNVTGNLTGNADTVTNGVVTSGSYSNPAWIVSLDDDKVLPSMTGNSGKALLNDGTNSYWGTIDLTTKANTDGSNATGTWSISISGNAATVTNGVYTTGSYSNPSWITSIDYSKLTGTVPTWNQNTTGNAATATNPQSGGTFITSSNIGSQSVNYATTSGSTGTADRAYEWKGSGNTSNWDTQFQDTEGQSATQIDINGGTNCPTGGGWWFAESFRHSNTSSYWGTQYAHGWEDRAYQRYVRNVSSNSFGSWQLDVGCRLWVNFDGATGSNPAPINGSANVSSITRSGAGNFVINFATALINANYSAICGTAYSGLGDMPGADTFTTSSCRVRGRIIGGTAVLRNPTCVLIFN